MRPNEFAGERKSTLSGTELAASMAAVMGDLLRKRGIGEHQADEIALELLDEVRLQYGGQNIYFAREDKTKKAEIHDAMFDRFHRNEITVPDMARELGISLQWAYHILRTVRLKRRAERAEQDAATRERSQERWKREC